MNRFANSGKYIGYQCILHYLQSEKLKMAIAKQKKVGNYLGFIYPEKFCFILGFLKVLGMQI